MVGDWLGIDWLCCGCCSVGSSEDGMNESGGQNEENGQEVG